MRRSISATSSSQIPKPHGRMTIVPRTGPFSAISAPATTSWYQRGKSSARGVSPPLSLGMTQDTVVGQLESHWALHPGIGSARVEQADLQVPASTDEPATG